MSRGSDWIMEQFLKRDSCDLSIPSWEDIEEKLLLYTRVFNNVYEGIMITDQQGVIVSVNPSFTKTTGYKEHEVIGKDPNILQSGRHDTNFYIDMWSTIHETGQWEGEIWNRRKNGEIYPQWLSINAIKNETGKVMNYVAIFSDLTRRKQQEEKLRLYNRVFDNTSEGIIITDTKGTILYVNPAFVTTTGYSKDEAMGSSPSLLSSKMHDKQFYIDMWSEIYETGNWQGEIWNRRKNGEVYPEWLSINSVKNEQGEVTNYVGIFSDITERKKSEEHLKFLAHYDVLTELPNRFLFHSRLNQAIIQAEQLDQLVVILFLDLDRFKNINDIFGHNVGDELLRQFGKRLKGCVRKSDTVARLGGDEFTVLLPNIDEVQNVHKVAQKIFKAMSEPFHIEEQDFYMTPSIGISVYPSDGKDMDTLIKNADAAMYRAKETGNTYHFFSAEMKEGISEKYWLENALHKALERNEFMIHYQPQVDANSGRIISMEALLRWNHPEKGLIPPGEFIPLAEETGLIIPIGEWILYEVCQQNRKWQDSGLPPMKIAVNLSARQLQDSSFIELIKLVLKETKLDPTYLALEITESMSIQHIDSIMKTLGEIRQLGVEVSIDDFGTGNSSLNYLRQYTVDALKIDRSFVKDIKNEGRNAAIVKAIMELAQGLDLRVIAEGVETAEELSFFQNNKCTAVQGFYFSKPVSAEEMEKLIRKQQRG